MPALFSAGFLCIPTRIMERAVTENKKQFLDLLLLADEQESMIDRYLERGELFAGLENGVAAAVMVVTDEGGGVLEIKNLAVAPDRQGRGYGREPRPDGPLRQQRDTRHNGRAAGVEIERPTAEDHPPVWQTTLL